MPNPNWYNPEFPHEAQAEWNVYLSDREDWGQCPNRKTLSQLFRTWEWEIIIPRSKISIVSDALARFGI